MRRLPRRALRATVCTLLPILGLAACDAFDSPRSESNEESSDSAQLQASGSGSFARVHERARGGQAASLGLVDLRWGRRVDLWALDPDDGLARPWLAGVVVAADLAAFEGRVARDLCLATGRERLVVQHVLGSAAARAVLGELERGLAPFEGEVPADAVLSLCFDDLLDPARLAAGVALRVDGAPVAPARLELDSAHGVWLDGAHASARATLELAPQRVLGGGTLELVLDGVTNLAGAGLGAPALRSAVVGDASELLGNGVAPFVVGRLDGQLTQVVVGGVPGFFQVEFLFDVGACALAPQVGDVIETLTHALEVIAPGAPPQGASTGRLRTQLVLGDPATLAPGAAQLRARWEPALGAPPACFVRFTPTAGVAPAGDVSTAAGAVIEFSEPMLAGSVQSTATWTMGYATAADPLEQLVPAVVLPSPSMTQFGLFPVLPLRHRQGVSEHYSLRLADGPSGVTDVAMTPLELTLPEIEFGLAAGQPSVHSNGLTLTFAGLDEDGDGLPDLRGQAFFDLAQGLAGGRPVQRFSSVLDPNKPLVAAMNSSPQGLQNPLNPLGARQMSVWRYVDLGFGLLDDFFHNLDIEGLHWSPSQAVIADQFSEFRMAFAHSFYLPDEAQDAGLLPAHRFSGLVPTFQSNVLDALAVVHDKAAGYLVSPADSFTSASGTPLHPWPLNRNIPPDQYTYWTWRDTAVLEVGGHPAAPGADPQRLQQVLGLGLVGFYPGGQVPTIGEPLLMEFRAYPDPGALGLNPFKTSFALSTSYKPTFRAYSSGGVDTQGVTQLVDPDNAPVATGGYTPSGTKTGPIDNTVYWGQTDFVLRVSRAHTRWLDTGKAHDFVGQALVEYGPMGLPPGTQVQLAYRGASSIHAPAETAWLDAGLYDPYGDGYTQSQLDLIFGAGAKPAFDVVEFPVDDDRGWHTSLDDIDGARWVQMRLTFVANVRTNVTPQVAGVAIAWQ